MSSNSETSYAARLGRAYTLHTIISGLANYTANEAVLMPGNFELFLNDLRDLNSDLAGAEQAYFEKADLRRKFYKEGEGSLYKRLRLIRAAVEVSFGKKSNQVEQVASLIKDMRSSSPVEYVKKAKEPSGADKLITMSQSQLSYGSLAGNFGDLVSKIGQMTGYYSPDPTLELGQLRLMVTAAEQHNVATNEAMIKYKNLQKDRTDKYELLAEYGAKIKGLVLLVAGVKSVAYKEAQKLNI